MLPVSKDTLLRVADWMPIRGPYCSPFDIQNCVCIGRRSNMREYGRGSYPGDRREARPGIKRIGSLTPGGQRFGHLLQLFLRRPALRDR